MKTARTYCRICEAACGLVVESDERGTPIKIRPDKEHPTSRGFACAKGTRFLELATHPERLRHPLLRSPDGTLSPATWSDALAAAARGLKPILEHHGPNSIGVYFGNPLAFNALGSFGLLGFLTALDSRNVFSAGSQDCNNKFAAAKVIHGSPMIHPVPDFANTELAVMFGSNPLVSQASFVHLEGGSLVFDELVKRGGDVIWIDPRRSESAERCGQHLPIRPGTDLWLILALLHQLAQTAPANRLLDRRVTGLDELLAAAADVSIARAAARTGSPAERILALVDRIASAKSVAFHLSVGVNQSGFGTLACTALQALSFVTGNLDATGGSLFHPAALMMAKAYRSAGLDRELWSRIGRFPSVMGTLPGGILADEILTVGPEQIRALIVIAGNPVTSIPGGERLLQAFKQLDYLVCVDHFENDTGRLADVLLPSSTWLERWDFATTTVPFQTTPLVQVAGAAMEPPGEARHDAVVLSDLARAMGLTSKTSWPARLAESRLLPKPRYGLRGLRPKPGKYLGRGPLTPGHQMRFWDPSFTDDLERLEQSTGMPAKGEFVLLTRRRRLGHNSWIHGATHDGEPERVAWLGVDDLAELGVTEGESVVVETAAGRLTLEARAADGLALGTIVIPHGLPGANVNALIPSGPDAIEWLSGQHVMTGIPVKVSAARASAAA
ncbi:MAG: molybdopterin-dependent oxidoreductase [Deltaproteobacteria bacterium]|nr:molybdopterin-dependent oxidoreductase [Deltaproteobacteria bacterium]